MTHVHETLRGNEPLGIVRRRAEHKNHVWAMDFIHDRDAHDRPVKWLSCVDEFTRECVMLAVERGMTSDEVVNLPVEAFTTRGVPTHIQRDHGGEFIARATTRLAEITVERCAKSRWARGGRTATRRASTRACARNC